MDVYLMDHQREVIPLLDSGKVLYGGVGTGKSATAMAYYVERESPRDLYVITTAKKRDSLEWEGEAARYGIGESGSTLGGVLRVDSWNNIRKYSSVSGAFFIFDEQRVSGSGAWVKEFLRLVRVNRWVLLSATPGDTWLDYAPLFIANGWYKNITDFKRQHVIYSPWVKYPSVLRYVGEQKLERLRDEVLVEMPYARHTERVINHLDVSYDKDKYKRVTRDRWNIFEDRPIKDVAELFRVMRKIVNSDPSRLETLKFLLTIHPRLIVFYNFDYELEILRTLRGPYVVAEWNGHYHEPLPDTKSWVYLVQYMSGSESWNCTSTDAMAFYSLTYSYKQFIQAQGRIDRLDTKFDVLYYYVLGTSSNIDESIMRALSEKRSFNERELYNSAFAGALPV